MQSFRQPRAPQRHEPPPSGPEGELACGLLEPAASIAPKFLYDAVGSRLFEAITQLPEYYPTRTEAAIFDAQAGAMAATVGTGGTLVDLGAGNCAKAARLFPALRPARYVAIDISADFLAESLARLRAQHPTIVMLGLGQDFSTSLALPPEVGTGPRTLFYPGSSIGNFTPAEAVGFLERAHAACAGGHLLIGVDLVKDKAVLDAAYDDALGVTAAFNLNVLRHVNRLLGSDFDPTGWQHVAFFDEAAARVEMHLQARRDVDVRWPGARRRFAAGERIHTEISCKYTVEGFDRLLRTAGLTQTRCWTDPHAWFAVFAAR